jgi:hypothetical protein
MRRRSEETEALIQEYWSWFAVALFLLLAVDLLTTAGAASEYGLAAESNPAMRWLLGRGLATVIGVHLTVVALGAFGFAGIVCLLRRGRAPYDRYLAYCIEVWLGLLVVAGLTVFANNLSVIVLGESLV